MTKKEEILTFLNTKFFNPILYSPSASSELKYDISYMINRINKFSVEGIFLYFWSALTNEEVLMIFSHRLNEEDILDFNCFINDFKNYFTFEWLSS